MSRFLWFSLFIVFALVSCTEGNMASESKDEILQISALDTINGYSLNTYSGDSIKNLLDSNGAILTTGSSLPIQGTKQYLDSLPAAEIVPIGDPEIVNYNDNKIPFVGFPTETFVNFEALKRVKLGEGNQEFFITDNVGDTIPSGVEIPVTVETIKKELPRPQKAIPPKFKDNSNFNIKYLSMSEGLPAYFGYQLLIDKRGNVWFATNNGGITKYDGVSFTLFSTETGLETNEIRSVLETENGDIWFSAAEGHAYRFDGNILMRYDHFGERLVEDGNNNIWSISRRGLIKFDGESFTYFTEKEGFIYDRPLEILADKKNNIWIAGNNGICKFDQKEFIYFTADDVLPTNTILSLYEDSGENIWFGTLGHGVCKFTGESIIQLTTENGLPSKSINPIVEDNEGTFWFGGEGLISYDGFCFSQITSDDGLMEGRINSIVFDESGNLWTSIFGGGICIYNPKSFKSLNHEIGLPEGSAFAMIEDSKNNLWFGFGSGAICHYDRQDFRIYEDLQGFPKATIWSILEDGDGNIWFTTSNGLYKFDYINITKYTTKQGLPGNAVYSSLKDSKGNLWFGSPGGLSCFDGNSFTNYTKENGLLGNSIWGISEDATGNIWFSTNNHGMAKLGNDKITYYTEKEGQSSNMQWPIYVDSRDHVWVGSNTGITQFDGKNFIHYSVKQGLSHNYVWSITEDLNGDIWAGTDFGLNKITPYDQNKDKSKSFEITNYYTENGLKRNDFNVTSSFIDSENTLWLGNGTHITKVNMNDFRSSQVSPKMSFVNLLVNESYYDFNHIQDGLMDFDAVRRFENYPTNLKLPYAQNHLTFNFVAIDWTAPERIKYCYRLKGRSNEWSEMTSETKADYRNIPYGVYTFEVKAYGKSKIWSNTIQFKFTILAPWWHTWWARVLFVISGLLIIGLIVMQRTKKLKKRQKELENEVNAATQEIRHQKEIVEETHKEITDSIAYAKRLQDAILPSFEEVNHYLPENFILFKPKDIVSGDFYWFEHKDDVSYFASADCTGHGVPGAMVSVVCSNALHRSLIEFNQSEPSKILDKTRDLIIQTFAKSGDSVKDGMDIALCAFKDNKLSYSGANNPLWIVRKTALLTDKQKTEKGTLLGEDTSLIEFKASKQPCGLYEDMKAFEQLNIELYKGDLIYFFTDGFPDQFGGAKGKKFKYKPLKELLLNIHHEDLISQKAKLSEVFDNWKGNLEQVDDVCVIGVRI